MDMLTFCFALDLKDNERLIAEYEAHHQQVPKEIVDSIKNAGIEGMEIYRTGNRLFMVMKVTDNFDAEQKQQMDAANEKVQQWEKRMWKYQQALPWAKKGEKWVMMKPIFELPKTEL